MSDFNQLIQEHIKAAKEAGLDGTADFLKGIMESRERLKNDLAGAGEVAWSAIYEITKLRKQVATVENDRDELVMACLNETAVDFIRCGIGGNYGGKHYEKMISKVHEPVVKLQQKYKKYFVEQPLGVE